jgi:hypothetical protein
MEFGVWIYLTNSNFEMLAFPFAFIFRPLFQFKTQDYTITFDVPYDVKSIMYYESWAYAREKDLPTILTKVRR